MHGDSMNRQYRRYVQRIEEMERQLRVLLAEVANLAGARVDRYNVVSFLKEQENDYQLDRVEALLKKLYIQFEQFRINNTQLTQQRNLVIEERSVAAAAALQLRSQFAPLDVIRSDEPASRSLLLPSGGCMAPREEDEGGEGSDALDGEAGSSLMTIFSTVAGVVNTLEQVGCKTQTPLPH
eukprot:GHVT01098087.1.p1 GENE.GHVT01098087.1~~GHVT01098087.1.p1  ORF type:complete len:181 (+),score=44.43 GHVT01098087.1:934-1476(+)